MFGNVARTLVDRKLADEYAGCIPKSCIPESSLVAPTLVSLMYSSLQEERMTTNILSRYFDMSYLLQA